MGPGFHGYSYSGIPAFAKRVYWPSRCLVKPSRGRSTSSRRQKTKFKQRGNYSIISRAAKATARHPPRAVFCKGRTCRLVQILAARGPTPNRTGPNARSQSEPDGQLDHGRRVEPTLDPRWWHSGKVLNPPGRADIPMARRRAKACRVSVRVQAQAQTNDGAAQAFDPGPAWTPHTRVAEDGRDSQNWPRSPMKGAIGQGRPAWETH